MVVHVLAEVGSAREDDGDLPRLAHGADRPRPSVANDGDGVAQERRKLLRTHHRPALRVGGGRRRSVLDDHPRRPFRGPRVDPTHEPVEGVVIGPDDRDHEG